MPTLNSAVKGQSERSTESKKTNLPMKLLMSHNFNDTVSEPRMKSPKLKTFLNKQPNLAVKKKSSIVEKVIDSQTFDLSKNNTKLNATTGSI